jgi:feruloyl esterase
MKKGGRLIVPNIGNSRSSLKFPPRPNAPNVTGAKGAKAQTSALALGLLALCFLSTIAVSHATAASSCAALADQKIANTVIDSAEAASAGYRIPAHPGIMGNPEVAISRAFCRVRGTIRPSPTSDIKFEVWLPADWNGNYYQGGNGGNAGSIIYAPMIAEIADGYVVASTDDGTSPQGSFAWRNDPERMADYDHRAVHLTAVAGKTLAAALYGRPVAHAYFYGGSKGGQEALEEAQRYPTDFNGIVSSFPAIRGPYMITYLMWAAKQMNREPGAELSPAKLQLLHDAVIAGCVGKDGGLKTDGFLTYPPACHFDPAMLRCQGSDTGACLTPKEIQTADAIYTGPSNPRTGESFDVGAFHGGEAPSLGAAHGWAQLNGLLAQGLGITNTPDRAPGMPNMDYHTFDFDHDFAAMEAKNEGSGSWNADLRAFKANGGKLILIHGWDDPIIPPRTSLLYYKRVIADQKADPSRPAGSSALDETRGFARLFMTPGLGHGVSAGLQPVNTFAVLVAWVEHGRAPDVLPAVQYVGGDPSKGVALNRNVCMWPEVLQADSAGVFACRRHEEQ